MSGYFDVPTILALVAALALAVSQFRLLRGNRRKVLAEGSDLITQAAERVLRHLEDDNRRLREQVASLERREARLEESLRAAHRRIDVLHALLVAHGVSFPDTPDE